MVLVAVFVIVPIAYLAFTTSPSPTIPEFYLDEMPMLLLMTCMIDF